MIDYGFDRVIIWEVGEEIWFEVVMVDKGYGRGGCGKGGDGWVVCEVQVGGRYGEEAAEIKDFWAEGKVDAGD